MIKSASRKPQKPQLKTSKKRLTSQFLNKFQGKISKINKSGALEEVIQIKTEGADK